MWVPNAAVFQKPRSQCKVFNPATDPVVLLESTWPQHAWKYVTSGMTSRAGIKPHITNHSIRATTVTVLSAANIEGRYIREITGHQSEESIKSYCDTPTFEQFKRMSNELSEFFDPAGGDDKAVTIPKKTVATSSSQPQSVTTNTANYSFQSIQGGRITESCPWLHSRSQVPQL